MKNALTFDVEEYFHAEAFAPVLRPQEWPSLQSRVVGHTERILDILDDAKVRGTFFVLGWVGRRHPALVRRIGEGGHEVACHGNDHRMLQRLTPGELLADVTQAKATLEDASGSRVIGYRAPTFSVVRETLWGLDVLCEAGFRYDSSIFPVLHDRYGIPDAPRFPHRVKTASGELAEFPLSTLLIAGHRVPVAGGGYFRLFPYRLSRWALGRLNTVERQPCVFYLHPWELDAAPPRLPEGWLTRVRHTINTSRTEGRLRRLLTDFDFAPVVEVLLLNGILTPGDLS
jgi:polysaccharide deacetylase family protein (PEP-CTERM system associated)